MTCTNFAYSNHAIAQMFKRGISADEVEEGIKSGRKIKDYPGDKPYPSCLILYFAGEKPVHIVVSQDLESGRCLSSLLTSLIQLFGTLILKIKNKSIMDYCSICKLGELKPGKVTVTLEKGGSIVLLKNVPAQVCDNCSSYFLDPATTRLVLKKAENSVKNGAELEMIQMEAAT